MNTRYRVGLQATNNEGTIRKAQRTMVEFTDDLHGGPATETVLFGLDGDALEIDLNEENADKLRDALAPYVGAARRAGGANSRSRSASAPKARNSSSGNGDFDPQAVRAWAVANGIEVSPRGRHRDAVVEQ